MDFRSIQSEEGSQKLRVKNIYQKHDEVTPIYGNKPCPICSNAQIYRNNKPRLFTMSTLVLTRPFIQEYLAGICFLMVQYVDKIPSIEGIYYLLSERANHQ